MNNNKFNAQLQVIESYTDCGIDVGGIVRRIVKYAPPPSLQGLRAVKLLDKDPRNIGFASYLKSEATIELYVADIVGWQPWILRRSYVFPYLSIGIALGHELDHHANRDNTRIGKERAAESSALQYIYPSFGMFKPVAKLLSFLISKGG